MAANADSEDPRVATFAAAPARRSTPIRIGAVLGQARKIFLASWASWTGIMALGYAPLCVMGLAGKTATRYIESLDASAPGTLALQLALLFWLLLCLVGPMLASAAVNFGAAQELNGRGFSSGLSLKSALLRSPAILALCALIGMCVALGMILVIACGLFFLCLYSVAVPACVIERLGPIRSMGRSAFLTKGNRWRVFGVLSLLHGGVAALVALDTLISPLIGMAVNFDRSADVIYVSVGCLYFAISAFIAVAFSVLYSHLRVAREGIEVEHLAVVFD
jgi:hypothetical protein